MIAASNPSNWKATCHLNLQIFVPASARLKITISQSPADAFGTTLQFKQYYNIAKFIPGVGPNFFALKGPGRAFPVGQSLEVLKWRFVRMRIMCRCQVSFTLFLSNFADSSLSQLLAFTLQWWCMRSEHLVWAGEWILYVTLYDIHLYSPPKRPFFFPSSTLLLTSPPSSDGSYPTVSSKHTGSWSLTLACLVHPCHLPFCGNYEVGLIDVRCGRRQRSNVLPCWS